MRGKQLIQMLQVLDALSKPGGTTIRQLEEVLDLTRRSVERLLAAMQEMHIPVYSDRPDGEREKRWLLEESYAHKLPNLTVPNLGLTWPEVICLYLLKRDDPIFKGTRIERWTNSVFAKLTHLFPDEMRSGLERIRNLKINKNCAHKSCRNHETVIRQIVDAAVNQESIWLTYHNYSKNRIDTLSVNPLHIFEDSGGLYLLAAKTENGDLRTFAVERIQAVHNMADEFDYPKHFNAEAWLNKTFGIIDDGPVSVKILFSSTQARYVTERVWVEGQTVETNPDGSVFLLFSTYGKRDVKKWVLGWGRDATVIEPEELADEIRQDLEVMLKKY